MLNYNTTRMCILIFSNIFYFLGTENYAEESDMGTQENDKLIKNDYVFNKFGKKLVNNIINVLGIIYYVINYGNDPIMIFDIFAFVLLILGTTLNIYARYTMKNLFTFRIGIREKHKLITSGPYKYIAHPAATAHVIITIGYLFILQFPIHFIILLLALILYEIRHRIIIEENILRKYFGSIYVNYMNKTPRFIPFI